MEDAIAQTVMSHVYPCLAFTVLNGQESTDGRLRRVVSVSLDVF
jgi:hypothetical protein